MTVQAARLHCLYWIFQAPILIRIPSLLGKSTQGSGDSLVIYQEKSVRFWGASSWNVCPMDQVELMYVT